MIKIIKQSLEWMAYIGGIMFFIEFWIYFTIAFIKSFTAAIA